MHFLHTAFAGYWVYHVSVIRNLNWFYFKMDKILNLKNAAGSSKYLFEQTRNLNLWQFTNYILEQLNQLNVHLLLYSEGNEYIYLHLLEKCSFSLNPYGKNRVCNLIFFLQLVICHNTSSHWLTLATIQTVILCYCRSGMTINSSGIQMIMVV